MPDFSVSKEAITKGLHNVIYNTGLMGRWQQLRQNPKVICDTAHNKEGLNYVVQQLSEEQYNALLVYLKFIGIGCEISYQDIREVSYDTIFLMSFKYLDEMLLLFTMHSGSNAHCSYDDILRMVSLGSLV